MATFADIGISQPAASTITMKLGTVTVNRNSTVAHQELLTLAGAESSLEISRVMGSAPPSTEYGLVVRVASHGSSAADFPVMASFAAGMVSTATVNSNSSAVNVRIVGGVSSASSFPVFQGTPTQWATVSNSTVGQSTATPILSSAATRPFITAFSLTSTEAGPIVGGFYKGSSLLWPVTLWADGGAINVSQAVAPPGFIFAGAASRPVSFNIISGSTGTIYAGLTYRTE